MVRRPAVGLVCMGLAVVACQRPAEAPDASTTAAPAGEPVEVAVAPPSAAPDASADRPSAFGSAAPTAAAAPAPPGPTGIASCDAYLAFFRGCFKDPAARDAAEGGYRAMVDAWTTAAASGPEARQAIETACKQAMDAFPRDVCQ